MGCRERAPQHSLVRVGVSDGHVVLDVRRRLSGRGAYVHTRFPCVDQALARGLSRALKCHVDAQAAETLRNVVQSRLVREKLARDANNNSLDAPRRIQQCSGNAFHPSVATRDVEGQ